MSQGFVGRESELVRLNAFLQKALAGVTQVCFITGEAGTGKTNLIEEFVQRSETLSETLLFTRGNCNAQTGISDPYLPFRTILAMLTGGNTNPITSENTKRLDSVLRTSGRALVEVAPELVGTLIPGAAILMSLARMAAKEKGLFNGLEERAKAAEKTQTDIEQSQIFLQCTALLRELSKDYALVIILDDLHWVDAASNALLFHLVRELRNSRILFVGLYRPNDVAVGRNNERHPLEQTLNEIKRIYGDVWIDLDKATQRSGQDFVNALVDNESNQLGYSFRERLFERTRGHALFTTELLLAMQERGDLIQDAEGRWCESPQLDWKQLPARVEAIIEERIERLEDELRNILDVACVEGQDFTAEVVAKIQDIRARDLIRILSRDLERCHRLVEDVGEVKGVGKTTLWRYTFSHALFQTYLYNTLEVPERKMYHAEVAQALEELYAGQTSSIAVQLAYHYTEAGDPEKAATYLQLAGERACKLGEFLSARSFFAQALATVEADGANQPGSNQAQLLYWMGETYYHMGQYRDAEPYYRQGVDVARQLGDNHSTTQNLVGLAHSLRRQHLNLDALGVAQEALTLARQLGDQFQECRALRVLGIVYGQMDQNAERLACYEQSLAIAAQIGATSQQMPCLNNIGVVYGQVFGDYPKAIQYLNQALQLAQQNNNLTELVAYLGNLAADYIRLGLYERAKTYIAQHVHLSEKLGNIRRTAESYHLLGIILFNQAGFEPAIEMWLKAVQIADSHQKLETQVSCRNRLVIAYLLSDQLEAARQISEATKPLTQRFTAKTQVCSEAFLEGLTLLQMGQVQASRQIFEVAKDRATQILHTQRWAYRYHRAFAQAGVALLAPPDRQAEYLSQAREFFQEAIETCGWAGVLTEALSVMRVLQKADPNALLEPIADDLEEKRAIAWNNRPLND